MLTPAKTALNSLSPENLWLEEIEGERALDWVRAHNQVSLSALESDTRYPRFKKIAEDIVMAPDRIPMGSLRGGFIYNFWQDEKSVHGLWRRTTLKEYRKKNPKWETLLDLDQLSKVENENWVYKGVQCLAPEYHYCLMTLSRGGKDASVVREFDVKQKKFLTDGFNLSEAKASPSTYPQGALDNYLFIKEKGMLLEYEDLINHF